MRGGVVGGAVAADASEGKRTAALRAMLSALKRRGRGASGGSRSGSPSPERGSGGAATDPLAEWRRRAAARAALLERGYAPAAEAEAEADPWAEHSSFSDCAAAIVRAAHHAASPEAGRESRGAQLIAADVAAALALARSPPPPRGRAQPSLSKATAAERRAPAPALQAPASSRPHARADAEAQLPTPAGDAPSAAARGAEEAASGEGDPSAAEALQQRVARVLAASAAVLDARGAEEERVAAALALAVAPPALTDDEGGPLRRAPLSPAPLRVAPSPPRPALGMGEVEDALAAWRRRRREEAATLGAAAPPTARAAAAAAEAAEAAAHAEEAAAASLGPPPPQRHQSPPADAHSQGHRHAVAAASRAPLARRALVLDDPGASSWPTHSAPSDAAYTLLHAPSGGGGGHSPRAAAAAVFPPPPRSPPASPLRRAASPPPRGPSPPPLSLGPSVAALAGVASPPLLRPLALAHPRGREDAAARSPLGRDAQRSAVAWGAADVAASWPNHGFGGAGCDSPPPGGAHPDGGDDVVAALLQGTVEALLFGGCGGGASSDDAADSACSAHSGSASAGARLPDAFWPPEMTAEPAHADAGPAPQQQPFAAVEHEQAHQHQPHAQPTQQPPAWRAADDTPSPDSSGSGGGSDAEAEAAAESEAADPVVAALLARIAACRAELRALESPTR